MGPRPARPAGSLPNGLALDQRTRILYVADSTGTVWRVPTTGTIVRIPLRTNGKAGSPQVTATGLAGIDDFAFTGRGNEIIAALDLTSKVALVKPDGTHTVVLTEADGLQNPTSIAVRGRTVYVPSAAFLTAKDPNLLLAHLAR